MTGLMRLPLNYLRSINMGRFREHLAEDDWKLCQWAAALCGEVGEAFNAQKKIWRGDGSIEHLGLELADVIIYADLVAAKAGIEWDRWMTVSGPNIDDEPFPHTNELSSDLNQFLLMQLAAGNVLDSCLREVPPDRLALRLRSLTVCVRQVAWRSRVGLASSVIQAFNAKSDKWRSKHRLVGTPIGGGTW